MLHYEPIGEDQAIEINMSLAERYDFTVADIDAIPEETRIEIIDGRVYYMGSPKVIHQKILGQMYIKISNHVEQKGGSCQALMAPLDVYLNCDDKTRIQPGIFVVCDKSKLHEDACYGTPGLIIEIISKSTRQRDYGIKMLKYRTAGVKEYWIIDPKQHNVTVTWFDDENHNCQYTFDEEITFHMYPDLNVCINQLLS